MHDSGSFRNHSSSFSKSLAAPSLEASRGGFNRRFELRVRKFLERLQKFAVIGVNTLVGHGFVLLTISVRRLRVFESWKTVALFCGTNGSECDTTGLQMARLFPIAHV
jgi:hypothetical protein